jgi:hypothetical protein
MLPKINIVAFILGHRNIAQCFSCGYSIHWKENYILASKTASVVFMSRNRLVGVIWLCSSRKNKTPMLSTSTRCKNPQVYTLPLI